MKALTPFLFLLIAGLAGLLSPRTALAQACKDDEAMVKEVEKNVADVVDTVKKESLQDFQRAYHQKSSLNKLTFCVNALTGLVGCLDKAAQDSAAPKEDVDAAKAKRDNYSKLRDKTDESRKTLKETGDAKAAKALIEKIDWLK